MNTGFVTHYFASLLHGTAALLTPKNCKAACAFGQDLIAVDMVHTANLVAMHCKQKQSNMRLRCLRKMLCLGDLDMVKLEFDSATDCCTIGQIISLLR